MRQQDDSDGVTRFADGTGKIEQVPPIDDHLVELVHDLKSPLATIALEMSLLQERLAAGSPAVRAAMARITRNVGYIDRLVHDLLDSSSLEAGELSLQRRTTELCGLLRLVIDRAVPSRDRARVHFEAPDAVVADVDALRIERVVGNLLSNALKYAPSDSNIVVCLEQLDASVRISVIDTGPGLDAGARQSVFERFSRTDEARAREGTGLGLYVARRIVEAHGGTIGVDATRHAGSRFYFEIPAS